MVDYHHLQWVLPLQKLSNSNNPFVILNVVYEVKNLDIMNPLNRHLDLADRKRNESAKSPFGLSGS